MIVNIYSNRVPVKIHFEYVDGLNFKFKDEIFSCGFVFDDKFLLECVVPALIKNIRDIMDVFPLDSTDVLYSKSFGLDVQEGDELNSGQVDLICDEIKILEICIEKSAFNYFYIEGWILDPFNRLWQVCPGEYTEGWFVIDNDNIENWSKYAILNGIDVKDMMRY